MNKKNFLNLLKEQILISDGATGTMLRKMGLPDNLPPEEWNLTSPKKIRELHLEYINSGADIITTNTFGANEIRLSNFGLDKKLKDIIKYGVQAALDARSKSKRNVLIAGSIGPTGIFMRPFGELSFEKVYKIFSEVIQIFNDTAVDLITIETMTDIQELKACILAVKQYTDRPLIVQMSFNADVTVTGTGPDAFAVLADSLNADVIGINCGTTPEEQFKPLKIILENTEKPIIIQPNAGIPILKDSKLSFSVSGEQMCDYALKYYLLGANIIGTCCGSTPEYTRLISKRLKGLKPVKRKIIYSNVISDRIKSVRFGPEFPFLIVGERINTSTNKKLNKTILRNDFSYLKLEAFKQVENNAAALDIHITTTSKKGVWKTKFEDIIYAILNTVNCPLFIDSTDIKLIEQGLKLVPGKSVINSVINDNKVLNDIIPIIKKYGASVVALAMDSKGLSFDYKQRVKCALSLFEKLVSAGIPENDILIDPIATPVSIMNDSANVTLRTLEEISKRGLTTVLGLSNISIGLPDRTLINSTFLSLALNKGLNCAILNPLDRNLLKTITVFNLLAGNDKECKNYINLIKETASPAPPDEIVLEKDIRKRVHQDIILGLTENINSDLQLLLEVEKNPFNIINRYLIPAIEFVGQQFESGEYFLPQIISSAKTMQNAIEFLTPYLKKKKSLYKKKILLATVEGDIHDIGKNLVKIVLEGYGYSVIDAGKNVKPQRILELIHNERCDIIGLSILMTNTLKNLEKTIKFLRANKINIPIIIGGAAVNKKIANQLNCIYCKDVIQATKILKQI